MHHKTVASLAVALLLGAAACGALGGGATDPPSPSTTTGGATTSAASSTEPASVAPSSTGPTSSGSPSPSNSLSSTAGSAPTPADPNQPGGADQLGQAVATRNSAESGKKVTMVLYPVFRSGTTSHVNFTLSSPTPRTKSLQVAQMLADDNYSAIDKSGFSVDGVQLVDGKHAKLYLVASDGAGQCLCSRNLSNVFLSENNPVLFSATFAAPPADVSSVDVRVPNFGTVKSVPLR